MMDYYIVHKRINLPVGKRICKKDDIISSDELKEGQLKRFLDKDYVKPYGIFKAHDTDPLDNISTLSKPSPDAKRYFTPEQISKLTKTQLMEYGRSIGVAGIGNNMNNADLRAAINVFISEMIEKGI